MQDSKFLIQFEAILEYIIDNIENQDLEGRIDIDLNNTILTLVSDEGTFVINKQSSTQEIWLSSPISGPYHFFYQNNIWISRHGDKLFTILTNELRIELPGLNNVTS